MERSQHHIKTWLSICSLALIPTSMAMAKPAKKSDDMLGKFKIISTKYGTERALIQCKKDKKGRYYFQVEKLLNKKGVDYQTVCQNCPGKFKNKPINGMIIAWNFKPSKKNPHAFTGGYGIDAWSGRMFQGSIKLSSSKNIVKIRAHPLGTKFVSRSFNFIRAKK